MLFKELVEIYFEALERTSSRTQLVNILADMFKKICSDEIDKVVYFTLGEVLPPFESVKFGINEKTCIDVLSRAANTKKSEIKEYLAKYGDLGSVAVNILNTDKTSSNKTITEIHDYLLKIAKTQGTSNKSIMLFNLLKSVHPIEAKYILRLITRSMKLNLREPTIIEALSFITVDNIKLEEEIQRAYNIYPDIGFIAKLVKKSIENSENVFYNLQKIKITPGIPVLPMLAEKLSSSEEIAKKLGKCFVEVKYDGFRLQIHKKGNEVRIFSRSLENMTDLFPDIKFAVLNEIKAKEIIFEAEAVAYNENTDEFYPFQITIKRKRKHDIQEYIKEYPLKLLVFDILYYNGEDYTIKPFKDRREKIEEIFSNTKFFNPSESIFAEDAKQIEEFFNESVSRGFEGIIAKKIDSQYNAGFRNYSWIKLKRIYKSTLSDTIDAVILGYYHGKGARSKLGIGALLVGVYDKNTNTFKTLCKVGSGFTEKELIELKNILDKIKVDRKPVNVDSNIEPDVWVIPKYVTTIIGDEITKSTIHTAGYSIRFPRVVNFLRLDKRPEECDFLVHLN